MFPSVLKISLSSPSPASQTTVFTVACVSLRDRWFVGSTGGQIHGALFRSEDLKALAAAFQREEEMREKEERRMALKRQQFEDSMVRTVVA